MPRRLRRDEDSWAKPRTALTAMLAPATILNIFRLVIFPKSSGIKSQTPGHDKQRSCSWFRKTEVLVALIGRSLNDSDIAARCPYLMRAE